MWASLLASCLLGWLARPLASQVRGDGGSETLRAVGPALGQGITLAALGGYSDIAANFVWIRMNRSWERRMREEVISRLRIATSLSPESTFFWVNGARIVANDMPVWEVGDDFMATLQTTAEGREIQARYARLALELLDDAPPAVASSEALLVEKCVIYWRKLDDLAAAIEILRALVERPETPYYLHRIYGELLVRAGRPSEALAFLERHYATLPDEDPAALKPVVASRIRELRQRMETLNLPQRGEPE